MVVIIASSALCFLIGTVVGVGFMAMCISRKWKEDELNGKG